MKGGGKNSTHTVTRGRDEGRGEEFNSYRYQGTRGTRMHGFCEITFIEKIERNETYARVPLWNNVCRKK